MQSLLEGQGGAGLQQHGPPPELDVSPEVARMQQLQAMMGLPPGGARGAQGACYSDATRCMLGRLLWVWNVCVMLVVIICIGLVFDVRH